MKSQLDIDVLTMSDMEENTPCTKCCCMDQTLLSSLAKKQLQLVKSVPRNPLKQEKKASVLF